MGCFVRTVSFTLIKSMSLATRCPHCKTVFRVGEEQLKFCSGMVRCGVCRQAFNGIDHLVGRLSGDSEPVLSSEKPSAEKKPAFSASEAPTDQPDSNRRTAESGQPPETPFLQTEVLKAAFDRQLQSISLDLNDPPAASDNVASPVVDAETHPAASPLSQEEKNLPAGGSPVEQERESPLETTETCGQMSTSPPPEDVPGQKSVFKNYCAVSPVPTGIASKKRAVSRISRILWTIGIILLIFLLCGQLVYFYSERIATGWPATAGLVETSCDVLSCPRQNTAVQKPLSVEYGPLNMVENTAGRYFQTVTLTNNSPVFKPWPLLVVEIVDADHNVLSRRLIEPETYLPEQTAATKGLAAGETTVFSLFFEFDADSPVNSRITLSHP